MKNRRVRFIFHLELGGVDVIFHPGAHESNISEGPSTIRSLIQAAKLVFFFFIALIFEIVFFILS